MLTKAKQIEKVLAALVRINNFSAGGADDDVTTVITSALSTASNGGGSVPLQPAGSNTAIGVIVLAGRNRVPIFGFGTKTPILDGTDEVYGRLTHAAGVYTLTYYKLIAGVETAYNMPAATAIDFEFGYQFSFADYPVDAAIGGTVRNITDDAGGVAFAFVAEARNPSALNTLPALSNTPIANSLRLVVNGLDYHELDGSFSVAGAAITWIPAVAGFNLETTDKVIAHYRRAL